MSSSGATRRDLLTFLDLYRRGAAIHGPGVQIARGYRSEAQDRTGAHVDTRPYGRTRTDPGVGSQPHRIRNHGKLGVIVIVGCAANVGLLGNDAVRFEINGGRVIYLRTVSQRATILTNEVPRGPYLAGRVEMAAPPDLRAKHPQDHR